VNKPRKIRWARHAAKKKSAYVILVAKPEGKKPLGKLGISGRSILCLVLKKQDGRKRIGCIQQTIGDYWERDNGSACFHRQRKIFFRVFPIHVTINPAVPVLALYIFRAK
jgi:hypothetical protein